ncbi:hypothetical protein [Jeotgalibacillus proteolyticus]|uniref:Uncharacterized protein n=1 Tax=Jeotgalibacillus proteolyticus TaxID=2082395 RepID=A0A2S5G8H0_9BACL|nr:hypothetical protein [Jeotgalibacillus proteolyticus]PPA69290.1 hypothetical protein C4B60_15930 [Jeotgalibacillus proteolyticus]
MKKRLIIFMALLAGLLLLFYFVFSKGEFVMESSSYLDKDAPDNVDQSFYLGYGLHWEGFGEPVLSRVTVIKNDGTELDEEDGEMTVFAMIDEMGRTGIIDEEAAKNEGYDDHYLPVEAYKVDENFLLVFRAELHDANYENNISHLLIEYKKFGFQQKQLLEFEGFFREFHQDKTAQN